MKIEKNKVVFVLVLLSIILFIVSYAVITLGKEKEPALDNNQIPVPELKDEPQEYKTKLEALEAIQKERQTNAPSVYNESLLDSMGYYRPELDSIHKRRMIDSVYFLGEQRYQRLATLKHLRDNDSQDFQQEPDVNSNQTAAKIKRDSPVIAKKETLFTVKEMGLEHQLFFASNPKENPWLSQRNTDTQIFVRVDGTQTVRQHYRLRMCLIMPAIINGKKLPKNTAIYGFVSFQPNRTLIDIEYIDHQSVKLNAYDKEDGSEGIYIENTFKAEVRQQLADDAIDEINIGGIPQVSGIKKLFQRDNRNVKATILDNYQLILKLKQ